MDWLTQFFTWLASLFSYSQPAPLLISYTPSPMGEPVPTTSQTFPPSVLSTSSYGLDNLKSREGFKAKAYKDGTKWAIAYGHQLIDGDGLSPSSVLTEAQGSALLRRDLLSREYAIKTSVRSGLTQNMFDALVSLIYNIGVTAFATSDLVTMLNNNQYSAAANWIAANYTTGNGVPGFLSSRRRSEAAQFSS